MAVRNFTANNSELRVPITAGSNLGSGDFTVAALIKPNTHADWQGVMAGHTSAGSYQWEFGMDPNDRIVFYCVSGNVLRTSTLTVSTTTTWHIVAVTRLGTSRRFHRYTFGGGWSHEDANGDFGAMASTAGGYLSFGEVQGVDDLNARFATGGIWATGGMTDAQVEALATNLKTADWLNHAVVAGGTWDLDQATATTDVPDLTGNHATITGTIANASDLNGIDGTTIVTTDDPPGWTFGAGSTSTTYNDSATGTAALTGSATNSLSLSASRTGTVAASGGSTATYANSVSRAGTATVSGTATDGWGIGFTDTAAGTVTLSGTATGSSAHSSTPAGTVAASGTAADALSSASSPSGTAAVSGTATESWSVAGAFFASPVGVVVVSGTSTGTFSVVAPAVPLVVSSFAPGATVDLVPRTPANAQTWAHERKARGGLTVPVRPREAPVATATADERGVATFSGNIPSGRYWVVGERNERVMRRGAWLLEPVIRRVDRVV